jgi:hypothetical protein
MASGIDMCRDAKIQLAMSCSDCEWNVSEVRSLDHASENACEELG